ncbi:MAG: hypothetical protein JWO69_1806 [Thermoleophilia bacterium]|jgi:hypothetical protein|nr:hypothetical protein [Thermoleophilia bacterium]
MLRRITILFTALAVAAFPAAASAEGTTATTTPTKAHGLLRAATNFDRHAARQTATADELQVSSAKLRAEAAAATPVDEKKVAKADRIDKRVTRLDAAAAKFVAKAAAFRAKAATRLAKVDDEADAAASARKARGLLKAAARFRATAADRTATAVTVRTEALAATPIDQDKLDRAARLDAAAARLIARAIKFEAKAATHAARAETQAAA